MALPSIDFSALGRASRSVCDTRMSLYLRDTLSEALPRIPSDAECVSRFVILAGDSAIADGYEHGKAYSTHVMLSFLLGTRWDDDPFGASVSRVLSDAALPEDDRLNMALNLAIRQRVDFEAILPRMHAIALELLRTSIKELSMKSAWDVYRRLAPLRGITDSARASAFFQSCEDDACRLLRLAPFEREQYPTHGREGDWRSYENRYASADDYRVLESPGRQLLVQHVLLAAVFGRHFYANPLLNRLHAVLADAGNLAKRTSDLCTFLQRHQRVLTENTDGQ